MTNPQIAKIAGELTAAQKAIVLAAPFDSKGCGFSPRALGHMAADNTFSSPRVVPLLKRHTKPGSCGVSGIYRLTPLGQSVAAYLKEQSNG